MKKLLLIILTMAILGGCTTTQHLGNNLLGWSDGINTGSGVALGAAVFTDLAIYGYDYLTDMDITELTGDVDPADPMEVYIPCE